ALWGSSRTRLDRIPPERVMAEPWERQSNESEAAYAAFCAYRDLGQRRSVVEAYRQRTRKPDATQADGTWNGWVKAHSWAERDRAWDNRAAAVRQKAVEDAVAANAAEWVRRRDRQHELEYRVALRLLEQAGRLAQLPIVLTHGEDEGRAFTVEPVE